MIRTKFSNRQTRFIWCRRMRHYSHVTVCLSKCRYSKTCDSLKRYLEGGDRIWMKENCLN